ncbi:hypothetical protein [Halomonas hibernica]|uniref:hypothetical protein n=1 Tax=Halomonas hibernica TaxID=2591147 RepID=UPI00155657B2|nr:hypothetical protein [Halomonas hibernica]
MSIMIDDILMLPKTDFNDALTVGEEREHFGLIDKRDEYKQVSRDVLIKVVAIHDDNYEVKVIDILTP